MKQKHITRAALITLSVLVAAGLVLVVSGRLVWVDDDAGVASARPVCDSGVVDTYNDAMFMIRREGAEEPSIDEAGVKQIETSIQEIERYENEATCQTLLFWTALYHGDYESAKSAHAKVKSLHDQGVFADSNIRGNQALFSYEQLLKGISPEAEAEASAS